MDTIATPISVIKSRNDIAINVRTVDSENLVGVASCETKEAKIELPKTEMTTTKARKPWSDLLICLAISGRRESKRC